MILRLVASVLLTALILTASPAAFARAQDGPLAGAGQLVDLPRTGANWYGAYHLDHQIAYCADLMAHGPGAPHPGPRAPQTRSCTSKTAAAPGRTAMDRT